MIAAAYPYLNLELILQHKIRHKNFQNQLKDFTKHIDAKQKKKHSFNRQTEKIHSLVVKVYDNNSNV